MRRLALFLWLSGAVLCGLASEDDAPPIAIKSPDEATTFAFGSVERHSLVWDARRQMLSAQIVFVDENRDGGVANEDTLQFRLPGVTFDEATGVFSATSPSGEIIPVAKMHRELFLKVIRTLPNAVVRIQHPRGRVVVILEALRPDDPALRAPPPEANGEGRSVDLHDLLP